MEKTNNKQLVSRPSYLKKLSRFEQQNVIKVLTGQRRCGKSCILKDFSLHKASSPDSNIIYIDKENFAFKDINNDTSLYEYVKAKINVNKQNFLFIDEVQDIIDFEKALRSFQNENIADIYVTGSNAKMLSSEIATLLSGRYIEISVHPLSYLEFLEFNQIENTDAALIKYLNFGGLPYLRNLPQTEDIVFEYLKNVYNTIVLKDIIQREKIRNVEFLEILSSYIAENTGSLFSANNISKFLKSQNINMSTAVIISYIKAFCDSYLVSKVERTEIYGLKKFEIGQKIYFEDTGLRNCIVGFDFTRDIGKIIENAVFNHLVISGWKVFVGKNGDKEIDFVAEKNDGSEKKKIYLQACYLITEENREREFGNLEKIKDNYPKYVVSMNPGLVKSSSKGITHIHLREFLSQII